jgi:hypothetical protein
VPKIWKNSVFIFTLLCLCAPLDGTAQNKDPLAFGVRGEYGFIIPHRPAVRGLITGHVSGMEVYAEHVSLGFKPWQIIHSFPSYGVALYYADLGNPAQFGFAAGAFPYINFPLTPRRKLHWKLRTGAGLGWIEKPFDQDQNHHQIAIGSHFNALITLLTEVEFRRSWWSASTGISLKHFSNASTTVPNLGLNIPAWHASFTYYFKKNTNNESQELMPKHEPKSQWFLGTAFGLKEIYPAGGRKYLGSTINALYKRDFSIKSSYTVGIDLMYNTSLQPRYERDNEALRSGFQMAQTGAHIGWSLRVGKLDIFVQAGAYVISKFKGDGALYNRIGLRYHVTDRFFIETKLKAHEAKADFFEYGFAYRIK